MIDGITLAYIILGVTGIVVIIDFIKAIIDQKWFSFVQLILFLIFLSYMTLNLALGGSAAANAETDYELYEAGHYYLVSHSNYTEVGYEVFVLMKNMEIIGSGSFVLMFLITMIKSKIETGKFFGK